MATTSTDTYDQVGIKEDLADTIWDVSPEETPFASNCSRVSVDNTHFEWQTDALASVSTTTAVEGADASFSAAAATTRVGNRTEIISKTASTSGTLEATDRAGRAKEMAYQVIKRGKEIKRDLEHHLVGIHQARVVGDATTARKTASYATWTASNDSFGAGGSSCTGDGTDAPTVGTARSFTETLLGTVIDSIYNAGGNPDVIMCASANKRILTGFSGNSSEQNLKVEGKTIINAVSLYVSDYNTIKVVPNRFLKTTDVLVYETGYWKLGVLRGMQNKEIAATGDAEKRQVLQECGLMAANEASSGIILSLDGT
jgi:hypothetical protein